MGRACPPIRGKATPGSSAYGGSIFGGLHDSLAISIVTPGVLLYIVWDSSSMKTAISLLIICVVLSIIIGCAFVGRHKAVLEYKDVAQYKQDLNAQTKVPERVSGLCFRSMYCVSGIITQRKGSSLIVLVEIGPCKEGQSGSFSFSLHVPDDVGELRFGKAERLLWSRKSGPTTPN